MNDKIIPYDKEKFRKGGIYAALLPVIIGVVLAIIFVRNESFHIFPVIFSFVFVAPTIAILSVRELKRRAPFKQEEIFYVGFAKSSSANFCIAMIYNVILTVFFIAESGGGRADFMMIIGGIFIFGGVIQLILWLVVTAPLTMLCTMIFEKTVSSK